MNEKIYLQELNDLLVEKSGMSKKEIDQFLREFLETITNGLLNDKEVKISKLGTFKLIRVSARESVDIRTGERVLIPEHTKVSFNPDNQLSQSINKPFSMFEPVALENDENALIGKTQEEKQEPQVQKIEKVEAEAETEKTETVKVPFHASFPKLETYDMRSEQRRRSSRNSSRSVHRSRSKRRKQRLWKKMLTIFAVVASIAGVLFAIPFISNLFVKKHNQYTHVPSNTSPRFAKEDSIQWGQAESALSDINGITNKNHIPSSISENTLDSTAIKDLGKSIRKRKISQGERLTVIALEEYGNKVFWVYLYEENKAIIKNPGDVPAGLEIVIPPASKYGINAEDPESLWKASNFKSSTN